LRRFGVSFEVAVAIQCYLVDVNANATQILAGTTKVVNTFRATTLVDPQALYTVAMPPLKRPRAHDTRVAPFAHDDAVSAPITLPPPLPASAWSSESLTVVSVDGSFSDGTAGWGFTVARLGAAHAIDFCAPVFTAPGDLFIGAYKPSSNVAELSALFFALRWIAFYCTFDDHIVLEYDSEYAAGVTRKLTRPHDNLRLALSCRTAFDLVDAQLSWRKALAHTGLVFNERADTLAKCGATGITRGNMVTWYAVPDLNL